MLGGRRLVLGSTSVGSGHRAFPSHAAEMGRPGAYPLGWTVLGTLGAWPPVSWAQGSQLRLPSGPSSLPEESVP